MTPTLPLSESLRDAEFQFQGFAYVRPAGRGICLVQESGEWTETQLEDMVRDGYYRISVTLVRCSDQENFRA